MARIQPRTVRFAVPIAVAGVVAATIGLVPALASTGDPELPKISAEELLTRIASSDARAVSGTVQFTTDLGLPGFAAEALGSGGASPFAGGGADGDTGGESSSAAPEAQLGQLLAGTHTLRVAADGPEKQRVSIVEDAAEYSLIHNGDQLWAYDSGTNAAYHATLPADVHASAASEGVPSLTPGEAAEQALKAVDGTTSVTVDGTARVAGRSAYQLVVKPKQADSTVGSIRIAVDSGTGVPLKFTLTPKGGGKAVVDIAFTNVDFGTPKASTFEFTAPKGAKVTEEDLSEASEKATKDRGAGAGETLPDELSGLDVAISGQGWASVAELKLPEDALSEQESTEGGSLNGQSLLDSFGKEVKGDFGTGRVFNSRLVNALVTDDGTVYVGAVTQDALVAAADAK